MNAAFAEFEEDDTKNVSTKHCGTGLSAVLMLVKDIGEKFTLVKNMYCYFGEYVGEDV